MLELDLLVPQLTRQGLGPFFGLGLDALFNFGLLYGVAPWSAVLDAEGSARIDLSPGTISSGLRTDDIWFLQDPVTGDLISQTLVLEYDT